MITRYLGLSWMLLVLSGCVTETTGPSREADREKQLQALIELGVGYLRNGEYPRAKEHLHRALAIEPKSAVVHNTLALVFQLEQEFEVAEEHFRQAIRYEPTLTQARNNYGAFLFDRERYREAIEQLAIAGQDRFYSGRAAVFENLGISYLRVGERPEAEEAFTRSIALNSEQSRALLELADIRYEQRRYVESRELYRRHEDVAQHSAKSLWLCVRLARQFRSSDEEASCSLALRNIFPASEEYKRYQESIVR